VHHYGETKKRGDGGTHTNNKPKETSVTAGGRKTQKKKKEKAQKSCLQRRKPQQHFSNFVESFECSSLVHLFYLFLLTCGQRRAARLPLLKPLPHALTLAGVAAATLLCLELTRDAAHCRVDTPLHSQCCAVSHLVT
jgi:hypothetical protein